MPYNPFDWSPPDSARKILGGVGMSSWTPPLSSSNMVASSDTSALWAEAEEIRDLAAVKAKKSTPHGYKHPTPEEKLQAWAPEVVVSLAVSEVMTLLRFKPGKLDTDEAELHMLDTACAAHVICKLTPPANTAFIESNRFGLPSVTAKKGNRKASRNAILAHANNLDLMYMEGLGLDAQRHRNVYLLMLATFSLLHATGQLFKHQFSVPRPHVLSQEVQPTLQVPGHASYPAGHAAQAHAVSHLVGNLLKLPQPGHEVSTLRDRLIAVAERIGDMRVVAGLHYTFDCLAGQALGQSLASVLNALGERTMTWSPYTYAAGDAAPKALVSLSATLSETPVFTLLWTKAAKELAKANID